MAQHASIGMGYFNPETSFRPELSPRDIHVIVTVLQLKSDEITAVNTLYDGYTSELASQGREISRELNDVIEKAEVMQDAKLLDPANTLSSKWSKQAEEIKKQFLDDLRSLLTKDQEARWPLVERELRRFKLIGNGRIAGESVDLTRIADEVAPGVWGNPEAVQLLEDYAASFDRALVAREAAVGRYSDWENWSKLVREDPTKAESEFADVLQARRALRGVNQRYERQLAELLRPEEAAKLRDTIFEKSFPQLFSQTYAERYIEAAAAMDSLSVDQRAQAAAVREGYKASLKAWRTRGASVLVEYEKEDYPRDLLAKLGKIPPDQASGFNGRSYLPEDHPVRQLRLARYNIDKDVREKMEAILSAEQRRLVPVRTESNATFSDYTGYTP